MKFALDPYLFPARGLQPVRQASAGQKRRHLGLQGRADGGKSRGSEASSAFPTGRSGGGGPLGRGSVLAPLQPDRRREMSGNEPWD